MMSSQYYLQETKFKTMTKKEHEPGDIVKIKILEQDPLALTTTYNPGDESYNGRFATLIRVEQDDQWGNCWIVMLDDNDIECFRVTEIERLS